MQCASCEFQNMPGNTRCLRCGAMLQLAAAAIDIEPPRASSRSKWLRRWMPAPLRRVQLLSRRGVATLTGRALEQWRLSRLRAGCLPRLLVPGWAQAYLGDRVRGGRFLGAWLAFGGAGLITFGSQLGAILLGAMVAVHTGSIIDLCWRPRFIEAQFQRGVTAALLCAVVLVGYGWLAWSVNGGLIDSRQWIEAGEPFAPGDVVLFRPGAYAGAAPQPGNLVLYRAPDLRRPANPIAGHAAAYLFRGQWIDRVIAGPGSRVRWESGKLWVNDEPSELRPLNPARMPDRLEFTVPAGCYCIFPTTDPFVAPADGNCAVPQGLILGRAVVRNYPPWRIWVLR